jgi:hypothetical protein
MTKVVVDTDVVSYLFNWHYRTCGQYSGRVDRRQRFGFESAACHQIIGMTSSILRGFDCYSYSKGSGFSLHIVPIILIC